MWIWNESQIKWFVLFYFFSRFILIDEKEIFKLFSILANVFPSSTRRHTFCLCVYLRDLSFSSRFFPCQWVKIPQKFSTFPSVNSTIHQIESIEICFVWVSACTLFLSFHSILDLKWNCVILTASTLCRCRSLSKFVYNILIRWKNEERRISISINTRTHAERGSFIFIYESIQ